MQDWQYQDMKEYIRSIDSKTFFILIVVISLAVFMFLTMLSISSMKEDIIKNQETKSHLAHLWKKSNE